MKVAIIGAGVAGLACLHEFERLGIKADIFEQRPIPGDTFPWISASLDTYNRFIPEAYDAVKKKFGIELKPVGQIKEMLIYGPTKKVMVKGHIGWYIERGQGPRAIIPQLHKQVKTPVNFDSKVNYQQMKDQYDYVVIATGTPKPAQDLKLWTPSFTTGLQRVHIFQFVSPPAE